MKYKSKHHFSPVDELNREQEASLLNPFKIIVWSLFLVPAGIATVLKYKVAIDTFAFKHPVAMGTILISVSIAGLYLMIRKMMW